MSRNIESLYDSIDNVTVSEAHLCTPENCLSYMNSYKSNKQIVIITQNIRSISKNFDEFLILIKRTNIQPDVIVLTECWLSKCYSLPHLDGYECTSTSDTILQNDGVVVYTKSNMTTYTYEPSFLNANCLVTIINNNFAIISLYRSPSYSNIDNFINSLDSTLSTLANFNNVILIGDININIIDDNETRKSSDYLDVLAFHGLLPSHTYPTRNTSCLDHIILKTKQSALTLVIENTLTDHNSILLSLQNCNKKVYAPVMISKVDYEAIKRELSTVDFSCVLSTIDCNFATDMLVGILISIIQKNTHLVKLSRRKTPIKPWITPGLIRCMRHRDKLHSKSRKSPENDTLKIIYNRYRNYCNSLLRKLKKAYEKSQLEEAGTDVRRTWKAINNITNYKLKKPLPQDLIQGNDPSTVINSVNDFFANVGKNLAEKVFLSGTITPNSQVNHYQSLKSFGLIDIGPVELLSLINSLKTDCSIGWDNISSRIIKQNKEFLIPPLTHIFRLSFSTSVFPRAFKKSVILPIYKSGDKLNVTNYRPISILPALSKILERALNNRLVKYLESYKLISDNQFGFRKGRSTADAVSELNNYVVGCLDKGNKCLAIFIDLAKAFDTVSIPLLLDKLEGLGIRGNQLELMRSYLTERTQCVKIGDSISSELPVTYGIPQGSILGPTLFLAYMNQICELDLYNCKLLAFADDTVLLFRGENWEKAYRNAQIGFDLLTNCLYQNMLTLNATKTKCLAFSLRKPGLPNQVEHFIKAHNIQCLQGTITDCDCPILENCSTIKYLGVTLDSHMTYEPHIVLLTARIRKLIAVFKNIRHAANKSQLKTTYFALCQSLLLYCLTSWGGAAVTHILPLERAQRAVLKVANSRPFRYSTTQLYSECDVLSVRKLFIQQTILRQHKITPDLQFIKKRRIDKIYRTVLCKTSFAQKHSYFLAAYLYNKINKKTPIFKTTYLQCKIKIKIYLQSVDYKQTEDLLRILS